MCMDDADMQPSCVVYLSFSIECDYNHQITFYVSFVIRYTCAHCSSRSPESPLPPKKKLIDPTVAWAPTSLLQAHMRGCILSI